MCGKRLKIFLLSLVLFSVSAFSPFLSFCYAEVRLTDEEATLILTEIQESQKELNLLKQDLNQAQTELESVKNTYSEQKKYYEERLNEVNKSKEIAEDIAIATTSSTVILALTLIFILLV